MGSLLVVDDNRDLSMMLAHLLEQTGHRCDCADSVSGALEALKSHIPDLIIADLMMPERSGLDLLREVRRNDLTRDVPVIIFSAVSDEKYIHEAMKLGADDYWLKGSLRGDEMERRIHAFMPEDGETDL